MPTNTIAFEVFQAYRPDMLGEDPVGWWQGTGTPDGDREPFKSANKGSLYSQLNAADDTACLWQKVDEGNDDADWVRMFVDGDALISNADVAVSAGIVGSKLATNARRQFLVSVEFNIDNGNGTTIDDIIVLPSDGIMVIAAQVVYTESTDSSGVASANVRIGTSIGGADVVASTALQVTKAVGGRTALTLVSGDTPIAANGFLVVRHTGIASTEGGKYKVVVEFTVDD